MTNSDITQKLWNLCDVLRDDGSINYGDYKCGTGGFDTVPGLTDDMDGDYI